MSFSWHSDTRSTFFRGHTLHHRPFANVIFNLSVLVLFYLMIEVMVDNFWTAFSVVEQQRLTECALLPRDLCRVRIDFDLKHHQPEKQTRNGREMRKKGLSRRLVSTPDGKPTKLDYMICVWIVIIMFWEFQTKNFCGGFEFRVGMSRGRATTLLVCVCYDWSLTIRNNKKTNVNEKKTMTRENRL